MPKREPKKCRQWERDRRNRINNSFNILCKSLPSYDPCITLSKIEILQKAVFHIEDLKRKSSEALIGDKLEEKKSNELTMLEDRVSLLLQRNEQLVDILRKAGITVPTELDLGKHFEKPKLWSNKISEKVAQHILKKQNYEEKKKKDMFKKSSSRNVAKQRKMALVASNDKSRFKTSKIETNAVATSEALNQQTIINKDDDIAATVIVSSTNKQQTIKPSNTTVKPIKHINSISRLIKVPSKNTIVTNSTLLSAPIMATGFNERQSLSSLGPGTIIMANGTVYPVLPLNNTPTIFQPPTVLTAVVNSQPFVLVRNQDSKIPTLVTTKQNGGLSELERTIQNKYPTVLPKNLKNKKKIILKKVAIPPLNKKIIEVTRTKNGALHTKCILENKTQTSTLSENTIKNNNSQAKNKDSKRKKEISCKEVQLPEKLPKLDIVNKKQHTAKKAKETNEKMEICKHQTLEDNIEKKEENIQKKILTTKYSVDSLCNNSRDKAKEFEVKSKSVDNLLTPVVVASIQEINIKSINENVDKDKYNSDELISQKNKSESIAQSSNNSSTEMFVNRTSSSIDYFVTHKDTSSSIISNETKSVSSSTSNYNSDNNLLLNDLILSAKNTLDILTKNQHINFVKAKDEATCNKDSAPYVNKDAHGLTVNDANEGVNDANIVVVSKDSQSFLSCKDTRNLITSKNSDNYMTNKDTHNAASTTMFTSKNTTFMPSKTDTNTLVTNKSTDNFVGNRNTQTFVSNKHSNNLISNKEINDLITNKDSCNFITDTQNNTSKNSNIKDTNNFMNSLIPNKDVNDLITNKDTGNFLPSTDTVTSKDTNNVASNKDDHNFINNLIPNKNLSDLLTNKDSHHFIPTKEEAHSLIANKDLDCNVPNKDTNTFIINKEIPNFITNKDTPALVTSNETSNFITNKDTAAFVTNEETSTFVTNKDTHTFVTNKDITNSASNNTQVNQPSMNTSIDHPTKITDNLALSLPPSEFSNDIFASFQVSHVSAHPESMSPTAAFLLAFPLVANMPGGKMSEAVDDENSDSQHDGTPTLLQIGNIDKQPDNGNLVTFDNIPNFFSNKDFVDNIKVTKESQIMKNDRTNHYSYFERPPLPPGVKNKFVNEKEESNKVLIKEKPNTTLESFNSNCLFSDMPFFPNSMSNNLFNYEHVPVTHNVSSLPALPSNKPTNTMTFSCLQNPSTSSDYTSYFPSLSGNEAVIDTGSNTVFINRTLDKNSDNSLQIVSTSNPFITRTVCITKSNEITPCQNNNYESTGNTQKYSKINSTIYTSGNSTYCNSVKNSEKNNFQKPLVNWMTTPDSKHNKTDNNSSSNQNSTRLNRHFPANKYYSKSDSSSFHTDSISWTQSIKLPAIIERSNSSLLESTSNLNTSSTLPMLVGDLALNNTTSVSNKYDTIVSNKFDTSVSSNKYNCHISNKFDTTVSNKYDTTVSNKYESNVTNKFDASVLNKYDANMSNKYDANMSNKFDTKEIQKNKDQQYTDNQNVSCFSVSQLVDHNKTNISNQIIRSDHQRKSSTSQQHQQQRVKYNLQNNKSTKKVAKQQQQSSNEQQSVSKIADNYKHNEIKQFSKSTPLSSNVPYLESFQSGDITSNRELDWMKLSSLDATNKTPYKSCSNTYSAEALIASNNINNNIQNNYQKCLFTSSQQFIPSTTKRTTAHYDPLNTSFYSSGDYPPVQDSYYYTQSSNNNFTHTTSSTMYQPNNFIPNTSNFLNNDFDTIDYSIPNYSSALTNTTNNTLNSISNTSNKHNNYSSKNKFENRPNSSSLVERKNVSSTCSNTKRTPIMKRKQNNPESTGFTTDLGFLTITSTTTVTTISSTAVTASLLSSSTEETYFAHTNFFTPNTSQMYTNTSQNTIYSAPTTHSCNLLPPPPPPPPLTTFTKSNLLPSIQNAIPSPANISSNSLTNFNLSTIFPEINKPITPGIYDNTFRTGNNLSILSSQHQSSYSSSNCGNL